MKKIEKFITSISKGRQRTLNVLNGVLGDTLVEKKSSLAIKMTAYDAFGEALVLTQQSLRKTNLPDNGKICLFVHGSCGSESGWTFKEDESTTYGSLLQKDFGFTSVFGKVAMFSIVFEW